jgi:hypothetical protein
MKTSSILLTIIYFAAVSCQSSSKENDEKDIDIILPEESECETLIPAGVIPTSAILFLDILGNPCLLMDSIVFFINGNGTEQSMKFFDSTIPKDVLCFEDGSIWFIENNCLTQINNRKKETLVQFPFFSNLRSSPMGGKGIYLSAYNNSQNVYNLFLIDKNKKSIIKLLENISPIIAAGSGKTTIIACDKNIYILNEDKIIPAFQATHTIKQLTYAPGGIFYATENEAGYFNVDANIVFIKNCMIKQMLSFENNLYLFFENGAIYKITNTEYFKKITYTMH